MARCKYCPSEKMRYGVTFFKAPSISALHAENGALPKYGFHLREVCAACHRFQRFVVQTDANMLDKAVVFYAENIAEKVFAEWYDEAKVKEILDGAKQLTAGL